MSDQKDDSDLDYESIGFYPRAEVLIFPNRLLADHHVEEFLVKIKSVEGVTKITMMGPRLYINEYSNIQVGSKKIPLRIQVGKVIVEIETINTIKDIREICDSCFKFGYRIGIGRYTKWRETTMDAVRGHELVIQKDMLE